MKTNALKYIGIGMLAVIWLWLSWYVLAKSGVTLINLFWIFASAVIIFVPLYKRYLKKN